MDKAYLHSHSAMLTKIIQHNMQLSDALIERRTDNNVDDSGVMEQKSTGSATQKWI